MPNNAQLPYMQPHACSTHSFSSPVLTAKMFSKFFSRSHRNAFTLANKEYPRVTWWRDPGLRKLYALLFIPLMISMVNGYDGSMVGSCSISCKTLAYGRAQMHALQTSPQWQEYLNREIAIFCHQGEAGMTEAC